MHVTVKLFTSLQKGRFDVKELELPEGTKTTDVIELIGIPESEVALIFINSCHAGLETLLKDGDTLAMFPPVGGG
jgi:molybdopterin converting factor small subunit